MPLRKKQDPLEHSGVLSVDGDVLRYESPVYGNWRLPFRRMCVIGESTNENGPFADDYFLCFATGPCMWREASFYAAGRDEALEALSEHFGVPFDLRLINSATFNSRVLWPTEFVGKPLFKFVDNPRSRLGQFLFGASSNTQSYADEIAQFLEECRQERKRERTRPLP